MTLKELANELNTLIEAGYGDANAVIGIPTLYITEDGDISRNNYRHATRNFIVSAKEFLKEIKNIDKESIESIQLYDAYFDECTYEDYWDDYKKECEGEDDENLEEPTDETDSEDPDALGALL